MQIFQNQTNVFVNARVGGLQTEQQLLTIWRLSKRVPVPVELLQKPHKCVVHSNGYGRFHQPNERLWWGKLIPHRELVHRHRHY